MPAAAAGGRGGDLVGLRGGDAADRIHDRMPLTIGPAEADAWLDPARTDPDELHALLRTPAGGGSPPHPSLSP
ncbi:SOS response-associated peptidase family protein [Kitasatospora arboriphila]